MLASSCGESSPPKTMILGVSFSALPTIMTARALNPTIITGNKNSGTSTVEMSVRRSRTHSRNSFRYTMPTALSLIVLDLHLRLQRADDLHENLFQILLAVFFAKVRKSAFREQLAIVNDPYDVA